MHGPDFNFSAEMAANPQIIPIAVRGTLEVFFDGL
jgi:hypothetical protein